MVEQEHLLWSIGSPDRPAEQLIDNFGQPALAEPVVWRVPRSGSAPTDQRWPAFHPSEADPDAGYRLHTYAILFALDEVPHAAVLRVGFLALTARLGWLEVRVNDRVGRAYLRPDPSSVAHVELMAGLQTAIYGEGQVDVWLPGELLRAGENRLELVCRDEGETIHVERAEAIKRLDRMASAAGIGYRWLSLVAPAGSEDETIVRARLQPTVIYRRHPAGGLIERCELDLELHESVPDTTLELRLASAGRVERRSLRLPATAFGHLRLPIDLADGEGELSWSLEGDVDGAPVAVGGTVRRRPKWVVHVAPHIHTDIGYTHRQPEVAERLCRAIDAALELVDRYPDAFAFHLDSTWSLEHYLATRDDGRLRRLTGALRDGSVGFSGTWVDLLTQFAGLEDLIRNRELADRLLQRLDAATEFVSVVDVPSISGSLPALLAESGTPYLAHASNQARGPFRLNGGLHARAPYRWRGTAGGSVLTWLSKAYAELRKVCGSPPTMASGERGLELWLSELEAGGGGAVAAGGERLALLYGQEADNTDIDPQPAAFVDAWNRAYAYPRLVPGTPTAFFRAVEADGDADLPLFTGDGGAYWEDGVGSSLVETVAVREAQATLPAAERLESLATIHGPGRAYPQADFDAAWRDVLLYDEHTWGAFLSVTDPDALLARDQWVVKRGFAEDAHRAARWLLHGAASRHSLSWNSDAREVVVYNPHSWRTSGAVEVEIGHSEVALDPATGSPLPMRRLRTLATQAIVELWIDDLDGLSYRRLPLMRAGGPVSAEARTAGPIEEPSAAPDIVLESDRYRLVLDPVRGCVTSWVDRQLGRELVDGSDAWGLGELLHASGGEGTRLVTNLAGLSPAQPKLAGDFRLGRAQVEVSDHGLSATLHGEVACGEVEVSWTLYERTPEIEVSFVLRKHERRSLEALYVAFPLDLPQARVASDSQLGWVNWDDDRLPGACSEWLPLQSTIWVAGGAAHVLIASPDVPLFCVGDIVTGRWSSDDDLWGSRLFSYVLNNYWPTNYRASQGGELHFGYRLTSASDFDAAAAYRFGWRARRPLYAQRISLQDFRTVRPPYHGAEGGTLARVSPEEVVLTTLKPALAADGWLLRLQEVGGADRVAGVEIPGRRIHQAWATNLVEHERGELPVEPDGKLRLTVPAWGVATARIVIGPATGSDGATSGR